MRIRPFAAEQSLVLEIDELIMLLTNLKNGNSVEKEDLNKGVDMIDKIISFSEKNSDSNVNKSSGYTQFHDGQKNYPSGFNADDQMQNLKEAKRKIKSLIENQRDSDKNEVENLQKILLRISIPIWTEEVSISKSGYFKSV